MQEKYHITVTYGNRIVTNFESEMLAIVGMNSGVTCAVTNDITKRVELAIKVKVYLNSLIKTIEQDMGGGASISKFLKSKIEEIEDKVKIEATRVDPKQFKSPDIKEIKAQLKKSLYGEDNKQ